MYRELNWKDDDLIFNMIDVVMSNVSLNYLQDGGNPPLNTTSYLIVSAESSMDTRPIFINSPVIINMKEADPSVSMNSKFYYHL